MRQYWRTSLFSYVPSNDGYNYDAYRATVYTFGKPANLEDLRAAIQQITEGEGIEPKRAAWEKRQVAASDSRGLGFNWLEISKLSYAGKRLVQPEQRVAVFQLQEYAKNYSRLGYSEFFKRIAKAFKVKRGG